MTPPPSYWACPPSWMNCTPASCTAAAGTRGSPALPEQLRSSSSCTTPSCPLRTCSSGLRPRCALCWRYVARCWCPASLLSLAMYCCGTCAVTVRVCECVCARVCVCVWKRCSHPGQFTEQTRDGSGYCTRQFMHELPAHSVMEQDATLICVDVCTHTGICIYIQTITLDR